MRTSLNPYDSFAQTPNLNDRTSARPGHFQNLLSPTLLRFVFHRDFVRSSRGGENPPKSIGRIAPRNRIEFERVEALGAVWPHIPFGAPKGCPQERLVLVGDSRIDW